MTKKLSVLLGTGDSAAMKSTVDGGQQMAEVGVTGPVEAAQTEAAQAPQMVSEPAGPTMNCGIGVARSLNWSDDCPAAHEGYCNSPEITSALKNPPKDVVGVHGTCHAGCLDGDGYVVIGSICHGGLICRLTSIGSTDMKYPLCVL